MHNRRTFLKLIGVGAITIPLADIVWNPSNHSPVSYAEATLETPSSMYYYTSWIGNTFSGDGPLGKGKWVQDEIIDMVVTPDGTVLTAAMWDEGGRCTGLYKDGDVNAQCIQANNFVGNGAWGTRGTSVTAVGDLIFIANSSHNILKFQWSKPGDIQAPVNYQSFVTTSKFMSSIAACNDFLAVLTIDEELQIRDLRTMKIKNILPSKKSFDICIDAKKSLWILQKGGAIVNQNITGKMLSGSLIVKNASAISITPENTLLVCDNGAMQQILEYNISASQPVLVKKYGAAEGLREGVPGEMKPNKLFALIGAGKDNNGNIYVGMCFGPDKSDFPFGIKSSEIKKLSTKWNMNANSPVVIRSLDKFGEKQLWEVSKYAWLTAFSFDPESDGTIIYGPEAIFSYNPDAAPGQGWKANYITLDAIRYPNDPRILDTKANACSVELRRPHKKRLLYILGQYGGGYNLYAFEEAPSQIAYKVSEITGPGFGWHVDTAGGIWSAENHDNKIWHYAFSSWSDTGIPIFSDPVKYDPPTQFTKLTRAHYDLENDRIYYGGYTLNHPRKSNSWWGLVGAVIARYDQVSNTPTFKWRMTCPVDDRGFPPKAFAVAGDYLFLVHIYPINGLDGTVNIFNAETGEAVGNIVPSLSVGEQSGWEDIIHSIHAMRRSNGNYLIIIEADGRAKNIVYQWTPPKSSELDSLTSS